MSRSIQENKQLASEQKTPLTRNVCPAVIARFVLCFVFWAGVLTSGVQAASMHETIGYVQPRVVKIYGTGGYSNLYAYCTGFLVSAEGHIVTAWTHVLDADKVNIVLSDGRRFVANVMAAEPSLDVAVLQIEAEHRLDLPYFDLADSRSAAPGTTVLGFSNMFKVAAGDEAVSVIHGVVAARTKLSARRGASDVQYEGDVYILDAMTNNSGAAGGVVTTRDGELLGMIGKEIQDQGSHLWIHYCIPITEIREVVGQIISGDFTRKENRELASDGRPRYQPLDFGLLMVPDVVQRTPAYVETVLGDSAAAEQKLQSNDLVLFVNNSLIHSLQDFQSELNQLEAGDNVVLIVRRGAELVTVQMPVPTPRKRSKSN